MGNEQFLGAGPGGEQEHGQREESHLAGLWKK